ncbi:MAG TPA: aspartate-semialdehyde dehydrogenase [Blastocatellia bacterium]|jgi:aspartate-semialdehyde dehydrogenase|nr:aspartate-semialdehyde dehydrogenase [Blastocatellia bacterium]
MPNKIPVGVLGATGAVGQKFVKLLENHPWFELTELAASDRSAGKKYSEATAWRQYTPIPEHLKDRLVKSCDPTLDCRIVFSGLDSSVAGEIEEDFARAGYFVLSNSRNHRMDDDVPLLIAEVNPEHLELIRTQRTRRGWSGAIVTNPNCSTIGLVMPLAPIDRAFGVKRLIVTTMQALSGAGYPGPSAIDMLGNVVPYIGGGEEEKVETEPRKIMGRLDGDGIRFADFRISAHTNRVFVEDGHMACVSVELEKKAAPDDVARVLSSFRSLPQELRLPSAPERPVIVTTERDRPQPRFDRDAGDAMSAVVGRIRECPVFDIRFVVLSHNTVRGAAGVAILNAEIMKAQKYFD